MAAGVDELGALKKRTKAGTSCGGCVPLAKQIIEAEMKKQGLAVNNHLCEHFAYSRQELFHLVQVGEHQDLRRAARASTARAAAATSASPRWRRSSPRAGTSSILKPKHAPLQDTNDYFLANIQKDGTYSVVPRVPGGEITPES